MDIVKVFGNNISVLLNVIAGALLLKMFNVLPMLLGLKHINCFWRNKNA